MREHIKDVPAFPVGNYQYKSDGINKRLYVATAMLQGLVSNPKFFNIEENFHPDALAIDAFTLADALIKEEFNTEE